MDNLIEIFSHFKIDSKVISIKVFGSGHINDTYKVETEDKNYLLQRINHEIFKNIKGLTDNIIKITSFLENKIDSSKTNKQILHLVRTKGEDYYHEDEEGNFWRVYDFIEECKSFDLVSNIELAYEGGRAYGWFVKMLDDFPADELETTIPGFHNADSRIRNFKQSVERDIAGRAIKVKDLITELEQRAVEMRKIQDLGNQGIIPLRVTHNDTKINNVLFSDENKAVCVIDLDTVMPGYIHFDFGDAIRTFTNTGNEDEADMSKVSMNIHFFEAFTKGFLSEAIEVLSSDEIEYLAFSAKYIVYEQTIRFFSDYLNGDIYYKIKFPEHNLVRAKSQFTLLQSIEEQFVLMEDIIRKLV